MAAQSTAPLPRTYRQLFADVESVGGEARPAGGQAFEVFVPRRMRESGTGRRFTMLVSRGVVGTPRWR